MPFTDVPLLSSFPNLEWGIARGLVPGSKSTGHQYHPDALIPSTFEPPSAIDSKLFLADQPTGGHAFVSLLPIEEGITEGLRDYHMRYVRGRADDVAGHASLRKLIAHLADRIEIAGHVETRPLREEPACKVTTTLGYHSRHPRRIGLHVDTWIEETGQDLLFAPNRIGLNLGRSERWFLWVPYSFQQLAKAEGERPERSQASRLLHRLASSLPVLRVKVPPSCAYVAPTEAIFHDGSTATSTRAGLVMFLIGHFDRKPS